MMSNPNRLISLVALILLLNLTALPQQQPADSQANQNPQQPAEKDSTQAQPKPQEDQTKKDQQPPAENKKQSAQSTPDANSQEPEGWEGLGYIVHQTIEFGYRASDVSGARQMYNTLVNLPQG